MKRIMALTLLSILFAVPVYAGQITVDAFLTPDDVTISHLEQFRTKVVDAINNADGGNLQNQSITHSKLDANTDPVNRWSESFNNYVYSGLLPVTATGLVTTTSAGTAYIGGYRVVKDATGHTYGATLWTFVDLSNNGVYTYPTASIGATEPDTTANSLRLARVTTNGSDVTAVRDDRPMGISLNQEDYFIKGLTLTFVTPDTTTITIDAGIASNGGVHRIKVSQTNLDISKAADYISGGSSRGTSKWLYVYMAPSGDLRLDANAPDYHDTAGNTTGIKYYYYYSSTTYYRYIGAIRLDAIGSGNIVPFYKFDNYTAYDVPVVISTTASSGAWSSATSCATAMPPTSHKGLFGVSAIENTNQAATVWLRINAGAASHRNQDGIYNNPNTAGAQGSLGGELNCMTDSSQQIQYWSSAAATSFGLDVKGYWEDR